MPTTTFTRISNDKTPPGGRVGASAVIAAAAVTLLPGCQTATTQATKPSTQGETRAVSITASAERATGAKAEAPATTAASFVPPRGQRETFDPYLVSGTGEMGMSSGHRPARAPATTTEPPGPALSLYGDVRGSVTGVGAPDTRDQGGGALTQASFAPEGADFDPDVSSDGTFLVFASTQHRLTADIYSKSVDGRVVTQLTSDPASDVMPKISPDGSRIAFASNRNGNWDIFVMPAGGGKAMQVTSSPQDELHPSWSPDGRKLVFCRVGEVSGQWELWVTDAQNSGVQQFIGCGLFPEWCPTPGTGAEGTDRIVFQKSRERGDRAFCVWTIDYKDGTAGNQTEIASSQTGACINPCWSPDGEWIAFATVPNPTQWARMTSARPASSELWMIDASGGARVRLAGGKGVNLMPCWGVDNQLFFVSDLAGVDNIWRLSTESAVHLALGPDAPGGDAQATATEHVVEHTSDHTNDHTGGEHAAHGAAGQPSTTTTHDASGSTDEGMASVPTEEHTGDEH